MSTCPTCFMVRSAAGACDCDESSLPNAAAVLERPIAPPKTEVDPRELVADGDLANVYRVARALMNHYGLVDVRLEWNSSTRTYGSTHFSRQDMSVKKISLSRTLFEHISAQERMNTITHEIAHALVGPGEGHSRTWELMHRSLGGDGKRCSEVDISTETAAKIFKYTGTCPNGHLLHRAAKSQKMLMISCGVCSPSYSAALRFTWVQNF